MTHSIQVAESDCPLIEEVLQDDIMTSLLGDNSAALAAFSQSSGSWRNRHFRMRARAGRERIAAGTLTVTYVPGELQVADVGTKALPGSKLLGLLELINARVSPEGGQGPLTAKVLSRWGSASLARAEQISPTVALVLAMLELPKGVWGFSIVSKGGQVLVAMQGVREAVGQPVQADQALPVTEGDYNQQQASERGMEHVAQTVEAHEDYLRAADSRSHEPESSDVGTGERCEFPIVGRVDWRSNWVPAHYALVIVGSRECDFSVCGVGLC